MTDTITIGSDFTVEYLGARDAATGAYLNSGSVAFEMFTAAGVSVTTGTATYITSSNGDYAGTIESTTTVNLTANAAYYIILDFTQSAYNDRRRIDLVAKAAGGGIIDAATYTRLTGTTLTGSDYLAMTGWCESVSAAIKSAIRPYSAEPVTLSNQIYDAPVSQILTLRVRPVRSVTSIYFRSDARGVVANFTSDYLLDSDGSEYMLDVDDDITGYSMKGWVLRTNQEWGMMWWRKPTQLSAKLMEQQKCVLVNYAAGFAVVPPEIQAAAVHLVSKMMNSRKFGTQVISASLNGASYSLPSTAVGNIWSDPTVADLLSRYRTVHVG